MSPNESRAGENRSFKVKTNKTINDSKQVSLPTIKSSMRNRNDDSSSRSNDSYNLNLDIKHTKRNLRNNKCLGIKVVYFN